MKHQHKSANWHYESIQQKSAAYQPYHTADRLAGLELKMEQLIRAIEVNNELLRTIQEQQNRVYTSGGGSVIVRM
ncbi:hypothetical protein ACKOKD_08245 [Bacillus mojavensis]|uniref:hypothetical protein n=1 Tax=Bacillus mojavensis TaxID=72360 RepID=UPI003966FA55